ncbi:MAG: adenylosuccinate lyase [Chloroflexi bacterium]|nr:adenylosuccinate lyase [Chloroflexota bacterium]
MIPRYSRPEMAKVWSDENMYGLWLDVEIAASQAWTNMGVVPEPDMELIRGARFDMDLYNEHFDETKHDVVAFTRSVMASLGPEGRWIHHGLTSNDVKDTALSLQLVQTIDLLDADIKALMDALQQRAEEFIDTPAMGRSHGIHAEPMSFGLKFALWWDEMRRHKQRLAQTRDIVGVGKLSGPVGTYASVPPEIEETACRELGLAPAPVSNQIIQRDRHAQFVQALALIAASLDKFATEIRSLQRTEIREVEEPFGREGYVSTGSSSMPHKRNPELCERICGLARLVRGHTVTALDNVALWHERDISHSSAERMILPDSSLAVDYILDLFTGVVRNMRIFPKRMMANLELTRGLPFSPRVLLALVESGMDRTEAYKKVQALAMRSWDEELDFRELLRADRAVKDAIGGEKLETLFDYEHFLRYTRHTYRRLGFSVPADPVTAN